jgi:hypothetical protein
MTGVFLTLSVFIFGFIPASGQDFPRLKRVDTFPKPYHNLFFRTSPFISIDAAGSIYAADNREHAVYKIDMVRDEVKTIAKKGQGPGEVEMPFDCFIAGETLFVKDQNGLNLFDLQGKFKNRFKLLKSSGFGGADSETIFLPQAGSEYLIHAYSYKGERKKNFGYKYPVKEKIYKGWPPSSIDSMLNQGKVIVGTKFIFFISYAFSEIFKYDLSGNLLEISVIEEDELTKTSRDHYLVKGQNMPASQLFYSTEIVIDGCFFDGNLYFLRRFVDKEKKRRVVLIKIPEDDIPSVQKIYFEPAENMDERYLRRMCVGGPDLKHPLIYISLYDDKNEDIIIKIFQEIK